VRYDIADIATLNPDDLVVTASAGLPVFHVTAGGHMVAVTVSGRGTVDVYDEGDGLTDDVVDALVIQGADARTKITIVTSLSGAVSVGKILTGDDVYVGALQFDGNLIGDENDEVDLALDGGVTNLTLGAMGGDVSWTGRIGSDIRRLAIGTQGLGNLRIGGSVRGFTLFEGADDLWLAPTGNPTWPGEDGAAMASDADGHIWLYDGVTGELHPADDPDVGRRVTITDALYNSLNIEGMDFFNIPHTMYAVATLYNQIPSQQVGPTQDGPVDLVGLAVNAFGRVMAVEKGTTTASGYDELVEIDTQTGVRTTIGILRDVYSNLFLDNVMALAFDNAGRLYALLADYDGLGPAFDSNDGVLLAAVETTDVNGDWTLRVGHPHPAYSQYPGALLDGGAVTDTFTAMAVNNDGDIYAIRVVGGQDELVQLVMDDTVPGLPTVSANPIGIVQAFGADTSIVGMGFDADGNLMAYNSDGIAADMIAIDVADPGSSTPITGVGVLDPTIDAFAVGRTDAFIAGWDDSDYPTFAYDTDDPAGSTLYTNPGVIQTLGIVDADPGVGSFMLLQGLSQEAEDADGNPISGVALSSAVVDIAVDNTGLVYVVTADGRLLSYSGADGTLDDEVAQLVDPYTGETPVISAIDFDEASGDLIGFDARYHRLVTIDIDVAAGTAGTTVPRTESGSMDGDELRGLVCDPAGGGFYTFDTTTGEVMQLRRIDHVVPSGIVAASIGKLTITTEAGYHGRIATTGNTFGKVTVIGDFLGLLASATNINSVKINGGGVFGGALTADGSIKVEIRGGDFMVNGLISAGETLNLTVTGGDFAGTIVAQTAGAIRVGVDIPDDDELEATEEDLAEADVNIRDHVGLLSLGDVFTGTVNLGSAGAAKFGGLADEASVRIVGDVGSLIVANQGATDDTNVLVLGRLGGLTVGGVHSGAIAVAHGIGKSKLATMYTGILIAGEDSGSVTVANAYDSLLSFGTWIGDDLVYNTADDRITGGSVNSVDVRGVFEDSALVAGVLPNLNAGPGVPSDMRAYIGDGDAEIAYADAAEAGGLLFSRIGSVRIRGNVVNTSPLAGRLSVVAAADELGRVRLQRKGSTLRTRVYGDPFGAPTVVDVISVNDSEIEIIFSEEMNSASFTLAQDVDYDFALDSPSDIQGTVLVRDAYNAFVEGLELDYETRITDDGIVQGVLLIRREGGFGTPMMQIQILGDVDLGAYDRSGLRSSFRDPNQDGNAEEFEDRPGTLLDGDANTFEGGAFWLIPYFDDVGDTFADAAWIDFSGPAGGDYVETAQILEWFDTYPDDNGWSDVDVFGFYGFADEFFMYEYDGVEVELTTGLFFLDDQGTPGDPDDDFYELVARYEDPMQDTVGALDQAIELPREGYYYLVVAYLGSNLSRYSLDVTLASSDDMLNGRIDGLSGLPVGEEIAYVSNKVDDANNLLGANTPLQLVYLDFDGGQTTKYWMIGRPDVSVAPFDAAFLDPSFEGKTDELINGDGGSVTGIVDNVISVYQNNPVGSVDVVRIDSQAQWEQAQDDFDNDLNSGGLYFTTVDPATWGLDPETQFTTVFFDMEHSLTFSPAGGVSLGLASTVDLANMSKADNALVFADGYILLGEISNAPTLTGRLNEWSMRLANTAAHELGHTLGLNHQPKTRVLAETTLLEDDPDNAGPLTSADSNTGLGLMAYPPMDEGFVQLFELGTLDLSYPAPPAGEFPIGQIDTADLMVWWLT